MKQPEFKLFEVDGNKYRAARINVVDQLDITSKLGNVLPVVAQFRDYMRTHQGVSILDLDAEVLGILGKAMSSFPDDDRRYLLAKVMGVVQRDQSGKGNWLDVWDNGAEGFNFDDIDLRVLFILAGHVFGHNLASFTAALGLNT